MLMVSVTDMLESIGDSLPRFSKYSSLFPNTPGLQNALFKIYIEILQFSVDARAIFKKRHSGKNDKMTRLAQADS
jgi:hypothetical protein